jgi:hypothetical protein
MSWSANYQTNMARREDGQMLTLIHASGIDSDEAKKSHATAVRAMGEIVLSGVLGEFPRYDFYVNIAGHSNAGNEPVDGWSNDFLSIMITQKEKVTYESK